MIGPTDGFVYHLNVAGDNETGVSVDVVIELGATGGLPGAPTLDAVAGILYTALAGITGVTSTNAQKTATTTADFPLS